MEKEARVKWTVWKKRACACVQMWNSALMKLQRIFFYFIMFMLLFDIEFLNGYRYRCRYHYCIASIYIYTMLINCCGLVYATERPTSPIIGINDDASVSKITKILPSPTSTQTKPSSTIYISSLDDPIAHGINYHHLFFFP